MSVMSRAAWTSATPRWNQSKPMNGVTRMTVHHDALNAAGMSGQSAAAQRLESIRRGHIARGQEWVDIGYHYIIDPDGRVWEGRPVSIEGAHVAATNDHNLGIMCMGNFDQHRPTGAQLQTLEAFLREKMRTYNIGPARVYTHRELKDTACPGKHLQAHMMDLRRSL
jgi:hypothetical protein